MRSKLEFHLILVPMFVAFGGVAPLRAGGQSATPSTAWGQTVLDVRLQSDANLRIEDFGSQIAVKKGQPLERSIVTESLKNLYATGRFLALSADTQTEPTGVILTFQAQAQFFVGAVSVEGAPKSVDPTGLVSASRLRLGQPVSDEDIAAARERLATTLADSAYYQAKIEPRETRDVETQEMNITFQIDAGLPARLSGVEFLGSTFEPGPALLRVARWHVGMHLTSTRVEQGLSKIRRFYWKQRRLEANVRVQKRKYDLANRTERLSIDVNAGPEVVVQVRGASLSSSKLQQILPVYRDRTADDLSLLEGARELENYFERQGYFSAKASVDTKRSAGRLDVTYTVAPGKQGEFVGYAFHGNHSIPASDLASVLQIQPQDFPQLPRGIFDRDLLDHDVKALTSLYQSRGYLEARVTDQLNDRYENQAGRLFVTFDVDEGPRTRVGQLVIEGLTAAEEQKFRSSLLTRPGQPYSPDHALRDRDSILTYLNERGYDQASVEWQASPLAQAHDMALRYQIERGPRQIIQGIVLIGNDHTRDGIINRQLTLAEGEPLNQSKLLESQQRLYDLGLFNQVQIAAQDPNGTQTQKTVLVSVEEAKRWTVGYGGGVDIQRLPSNEAGGKYSASPRIALELGRLNVGGRPQTFTFRGHFSNLEKIASTSYSIPRVLNQPDLGLVISGLIDESRNVLTFNSRRQEGSLSLQKRYSDHSSILARYSFRRVEVSNLQINPLEVPLFSQPARVATLGLSYVNDHRNNPLDATQGSYSLAGLDVAWKGLGSSADFPRFYAQNSTYYRIRPYLTFARNTRLGVEGTFGHNSIPGGIPLPELFFMGGSESHRGFALNEAGPRDLSTGFPIGGKALFLNQVEMRVPFEENRFGFVLFEDFGNVYSTIRRMRLFKVSQAFPTDFDYTVHAVGTGFRYQTPVGPLRLDIGYALNPPQFQQIVNKVVEVQRLPHFQFFLSVGQSF